MEYVPTPFTVGLSLVVLPFLTAWLIRRLRPLALAHGLVDEPGGRKQHNGRVPLTGGPAIFAAFGLALLGTGDWHLGYEGLLLAMGFVGAAGILDDFNELGAGLKFVVHVGGAMLLVVTHALTVEHLGAVIGAGPVSLGAWEVPFTILCVVGLINAINMLDGLDGLAGGVVSVMLAGLIVVAMLGGAPTAAIAPAFLLASLLGFLYFNAPTLDKKRSRAFLGDSGSTMLGLALAWFAIGLAFHRGTGVPPMTVAWILALPIIDTVVVITRRLAGRKHPMSADRDHLHHLLLRAGLSPAVTVGVVVVGTLITSAVGIGGWLLAVSSAWLFVGFIGLGVLHVLILVWLRKYPRTHDGHPPDPLCADHG